MVLAVVRSHYTDPARLTDREAIYAVGNALAEWLGLSSWMDIATMQNSENVAAFRQRVQAAV
jgi:hypothetical protein